MTLKQLVLASLLPSSGSMVKWAARVSLSYCICKLGLIIPISRAVVRYPWGMKPLGECLACFGFNFFQRTKVMQIQEEGDSDSCYKGRRKPTPKGLKDSVYTEHKDFLTQVVVYLGDL